MSEVEITGIFDDVLGMIYSAKQKAEYQVNSTIIIWYCRGRGEKLSTGLRVFKMWEIGVWCDWRDCSIFRQ